MKTQKKVIIIAGVLLIGLLIILIAMQGNQQNKKDDQYTAEKVRQIEEGIKNDKIRLEQKSKLLAEAKTNLEPLKKKFKITKDEFKGTEFYHHKDLLVYENISGIFAYTNNNGYLFLVSHYRGDSWIFHTKFVASSAGETFESEEVQSYSEDHFSDNNSDYIYETNTYRLKNSEFCAFVQKHQKDKIKFRLYGKYYKEYELTDKAKIGIMETSWLSSYAKVIKENQYK